MNKIQETTSHEYVFWCCVTHKWGLNLLGHIPNELVKVVLSMDGVRSDGSIWTNRQAVLNIPWQEIRKIAPVISATAVHGGIKITTKETKNALPREYLLWPVNPFDPTMVSYNNFDEMRAFVAIANALMAGHSPDIDENPYLRQLKRKGASATYTKGKTNFPWDKNVNPWVYYNKFVPVGVRKKVEFKAKIYTGVTVGLLSILILAAVYAIAQQIIY